MDTQAKVQQQNLSRRYGQRQRELKNLYQSYSLSLDKDAKVALPHVKLVYQYPIVDRLLRENESQNKFTAETWNDILPTLQTEFRKFRINMRHDLARLFHPPPSSMSLDDTSNPINEDEDCDTLNEATSIFWSWCTEMAYSYTTVFEHFDYVPGQGLLLNPLIGQQETHIDQFEYMAQPLSRNETKMVTRMLVVLGLPLDLTHTSLHQLGDNFMCSCLGPSRPLDFITMVCPHVCRQYR